MEIFVLTIIITSFFDFLFLLDLDSFKAVRVTSFGSFYSLTYCKIAFPISSYAYKEKNQIVLEVISLLAI